VQEPNYKVTVVDDQHPKGVPLEQWGRPAPVQEPVGALILGGVIDTSDGPEYEEWDVEWNTKAVEALQEKLVTSNGVTLMLYTTPPAAQRQWVGLTDEEIIEVARDHYNPHQRPEISFSQLIEAKLKEKNT
jgi:hypothetical protein